MTDENRNLSERIKVKNPSARHQIILLKDEIDKALASGFCKKEIWKTLHDEGKFSMLYPAFTKAYKKITKSQNLEESKEQIPPAETEVNSEELRDTFVHNSTPDRSKLV